MSPKTSMTVVAAVVEQDGAVFVTRRPDGVHLAGYWEFPGGKRHPDEDDAVALRREIREELDAGLEVGSLLLATTHEYDDRVVELRFYRARFSGPPRPTLGQEMRWVPRHELRRLRLPPADTELLELLSAGSASV